MKQKLTTKLVTRRQQVCKFMTMVFVVLFVISACGTHAVWAQADVTLYDSGTFKAYIPAWPATGTTPLEDRKIWDDEFATELFKRIPTYRNMSFMFGECFAGCFINDLAFVNGHAWPHGSGNERDNLMISCASRWDRFGYTPWATGAYSLFPHAWNQAVDTPTFANFGDAHLQAAKATRLYCVGSADPECLSHPQYHSNPTSMDNLTLAAQAGDVNRYAIIFNGKTNKAGYYNTADELYEILKKHYAYTDNTIAVLWGDGIHQVSASGSTWNKIDHKATQQNLWDVLEDMSKSGEPGGSYDKIDGNDRLFIYVLGHGGGDNSNKKLAAVLENFDVKNKTGVEVNDFHLIVVGIRDTDIDHYYTGSDGWGNPTSVNYDSTNDRTDITWKGSAQDGDWVHHGVYLKKGTVPPKDAGAYWTVGGVPKQTIDAAKVSTQWQPQAGNEARALILNMTGETVTISDLKSAIVSGHVELNDLTWEFVPEGGWTPHEANEMLEPMNPDDPREGYREILFDGSEFSPLEAYSLLLRYAVIETGEVEANWRNVLACHVVPEFEEEIAAAFAFGSRLLSCPTFNDPAIDYTMVYHGTPVDLEYNPDRGWGYEVIYPEGSPYDDRDGYGVFGPFDDSPNNREKFADECPEHLYNSFIGAKNFATECSESLFGDPTPCDPPEGIIFRVDVPNGLYRFVGAFGDADNVHAHRILAEDGGWGPPEDIGPNHVVLVNNFDQAQQTIGEADPVELGEGVYARVGFDDKIPPPGDGAFPSPRFVNMDEHGLATYGFPSSPILEVTQGYIRIHQLQGNSNDGPGGPRDGNGGDMVILELWKVEPEQVDPGTDGLVAYYTFENDTMDSSGNGLDGTVIGDPTFVDGVKGMALDFNGDDYVDCGTNDVLNNLSDAMTVSTWINIRSVTHAWMVMVNKGETAWRLGVNNGTTSIHYGFTGGDRGWQQANTAIELSFDEWYHVTATYDTNVGALVYIDGTLDASNPDPDGVAANEMPLLLGENPEATGRFFDGILDEVMIYNRALSDEEISDLANLR